MPTNRLLYLKLKAPDIFSSYYAKKIQTIETDLVNLRIQYKIAKESEDNKEMQRLENAANVLLDDKHYLNQIEHATPIETLFKSDQALTLF